MAAYARGSRLAQTAPEVARQAQRRTLIVAAVFGASIPVAFIDPNVASFLWLALFLDQVGRRVADRRS